MASLEIGGNNVGSSRQGISFELQAKDLPSRRLLGKGLSGIGYETTWKGARYARKDFVGVQRDIFLQEAAVLVGLEDHKNIVKTYGWTVDKRSCSLVLEYMDEDLLSLSQKRAESKQGLAGEWVGNQVLDMMLQITTGMAYLHEQGLAHGDLKTRNILVSHMEDGDRNMKVVKVSDFGLVRSKRKSKFIVSRQARKLDLVQWKAPEYLKTLNLSKDEDETSSESESESTQSPVSEVSSTPPVVDARVSKADVFAADVYSFAVICSHILTGNGPYPDLDWKELVAKKLSGLRPNLPDECHPLLKDLLARMLLVDPAERPSFATIRKDLQGLLTTGSKETGNAMVPVVTFLPRAFKAWQHGPHPAKKEGKQEPVASASLLRDDGTDSQIQTHVSQRISLQRPIIMSSSSTNILSDIGGKRDLFDQDNKNDVLNQRSPAPESAIFEVPGVGRSKFALLLQGGCSVGGIASVESIMRNSSSSSSSRPSSPEPRYRQKSNEIHTKRDTKPRDTQ